MGGRIGSGFRQTPEVSGISCTIVVSGELSERFAGMFADLLLEHESGTTRLSGDLIDQAELNGVLNQIMDLGLDIISMATSHPGESIHR
jgi:hypothetical protein